MTKWVTPKATFTRRRTMATMFKKSSLWSFLNNFRKSLQLSSIKKIPAITSNKLVLLTILLIITVLAQTTSGFRTTHFNNGEGRKLFGGYRITPKHCRGTKTLPRSDPRANGPTICMFNHECAQRNGEVVGACMDGFLFGACCQIPHDYDLETTLLNDAQNLYYQQQQQKLQSEPKPISNLAAAQSYESYGGESLQQQSQQSEEHKNHEVGGSSTGNNHHASHGIYEQGNLEKVYQQLESSSSTNYIPHRPITNTYTSSSYQTENHKVKPTEFAYDSNTNDISTDVNTSQNEENPQNENNSDYILNTSQNNIPEQSQSTTMAISSDYNSVEEQQFDIQQNDKPQPASQGFESSGSLEGVKLASNASSDSATNRPNLLLQGPPKIHVDKTKVKISSPSSAPNDDFVMQVLSTLPPDHDHDIMMTFTTEVPMKISSSLTDHVSSESNSFEEEPSATQIPIKLMENTKKPESLEQKPNENQNQNSNSNQESSSSDLNLHHHNHLILDEAQFTHSDITHPGADADLIEDLQFSTGYGPLPVYVENDKGSSTSKPNPTTLPPRQSDEEDQYVLVQTITNEKKPQTSASTNPTTSTSAAAHDSIESIILQLNNTNAGPAYSIVNQQSASYNNNEEQGTTQDPYLTKEPSTASLIYHLEEETRKPEVSTTQDNKETTYHYIATQTQLPSYLEPVTEQSLNIHSETSTGVVTDHRPDLPAYQTSSNYASYEQTSASQSLDEHTIPASGYHDASDSASHQTSEFNKMPAMGIAYPVDMSYFEEESNSANESEEPSYAQTVATSNRPTSTDSYQKISETTEPQLMPTYTRVPTVNTQKPIATYIGVVTSQNFNQQKEPQNFYNQVPPEVSISSHTTQVHNEDNSYAPSQPVKITTSSYSQSPITSTSRPVQEHSIITESYTSSQITTDYGNKPIDSSSTLRPVLVTASPKPRPKPKPKPKPSNKRPSKRPATSDNKKTSKPQFTQIQNDRGPQQPTNDYNTHENPQSNYNNYPGPSKPEGPTQLSQGNHQTTSHYNVESSRPERPSPQGNQGSHQSTSHYNVESSRPERPSSQGNQGNHQSNSHYNVESSRPERPSSQGNQGNHPTNSHYNVEASRPERPSSQGNHQTNSHYNVESSRPERPSSQGNQGNHQSTSHYNIEASRPERPSSQGNHQSTSHYNVESSRPERPSSQVSQGNQPTNSYAPQPSPTYNTESSLDTQNSYNQASAQQNLNQDSQQPGNSYQSAPVKQASEVYNDNTAQYPSNSYTSSASQKPQKQPSASEQNHQNFNHQQPSFNYNTNSGNTKPNSPAGGSNPNNNKQKNPSKPLNPNGYQQEQQYQATGAPPRPLVNYNQAQNVVSSPTKRPSSSKPVDVKNKPISTSYVSGPPTPRPTVNQINYHYDEVPPLVIADDKLDSFVQSTAQNVVGATLQTYPANVFVNSVTPVQVQEPQSVYTVHKKPSFVKVSQTTKAPIPTILITPKPTVINLVTASTWEQNPSYNRFPSTTPQPSKNTDYSTNTIPQIHYSPQQVITNDFDDPGYFGMQTNLHHGLTQTTGAGFPLPSDDRPAFPGYYGPTPVYPAFSVPGEKFGSQIEEETHTSPNDFVNFPPVRNPNLNMSAVASAVTSDLELSTPSFVEDTVLKDKMNTLVHKIVESLQGNFEALSELIDDPNSTASTYQADQQATTRKPTRKPTRVATTSKTKVTTRKPVSRLTTKAPTRKPSVTTRRPVSKRTTTTTRKPITRKPTRKATTTTTAPVEEDEIVDEEDEEDVNPQDNEIDQSETLSTGGGRRIKCGMRPHVKSGRIVGGKGATFGAYPWQVLVRESTWLGLFTKNKCGGVLISSRYVMTAAHCQPGFLASLVAVMGEFDISGDLESKRATTKNVKRVIVHRQYNPATFENDLALLELDSPVTYDTHIVPICMPPDRADFTGRMATVTGWGRLKYGGGVPSVLQEVQVPIIENSVCQEMFNTAGHDKKILNSFLCAGYANGQKDSCEGDSGGPLVLQRPDGRYELAGTVSHGIKCAAPYLPGVYMRTTFYKPWLKAITGIK